MIHIDPFSGSFRHLLPCDIYPFLSGGGENNYARARTSLKLSCLMHEFVHLPGSFVLEDQFVGALALEVLPFIESGDIKLDLRNNCGSYSHLAYIKYGGKPPVNIEKMALLLDNTCKSALSFDPLSTSFQFSSLLGDFAKHLLGNVTDENLSLKIEEAIKGIEANKFSLTLSLAESYMKDTILYPRFRAATHLYYSIVGARVTNSEPIIPFHLLESTMIDDGKVITKGTDPRIMLDARQSSRNFSNNVVMDYFTIDSNLIDKLDARTLLDFKREPMTSWYIRELDEATTKILAIGSEEKEIKDAHSLAKDRATLIQAGFRKKCSRLKKKREKEEKVLLFLEEVGGTLGNLSFVGPLKSGVTKLARYLAKKEPRLAWLDYSSSPIITYVSRFRDLIQDKRTDSGG